MTHKHVCLQLIDWLRMLVPVLAVLSAAPAAAQLIDWNNVSGGAYATAGNWNPANVPNAVNETAQFNLANTFRVTFESGSSTLIDDLLVSDGDVTFSITGSIANARLEVTDQAFIDGGDLTLEQFLINADVNLVFANLLRVGGGSTLSVFDGASVTADDLDLGITGSGNGTLLVAGIGSSLNVAGTSRVGGFGKTGTLTFQNGSTGNSLSGLTQLIGSSSATGSTGRLNVLSGASLQTASVLVGNSLSASAVQEGTLTVDGTNSLLTMTGASTLTIGDETNPNIVADVVISGGGQLDTGTGAITIRKSGGLRVAGGTLNANGPITIDNSSTLTLISGGSINANAGLDNSADGTLDLFNGTLTVTGSAFVPNDPSDDYVVDGLTPGDLPHIVLGAGATADIGQHLFVGEDNRGEMSITGGADVDVEFLSFIGFGNGSTGTATIDGVGSTWNSDFLHVGFSGNGALNIQGGGAVSNVTGYVGDGNSGIGIVTVDGGGSWTNTQSLFVGNEGNGTLIIQDGGTVYSATGYIGRSFSSAGTATIDGVGSTWTNTSDLFVGGSSLAAGGTGSLNVRDQGLVEVGDTLKIWSPGVVTINGGTIKMDALEIEPGGTLALNFGTLNFTNSLSVASGDALQTALGGSHTVSFGHVLQVNGTTTLNKVLTLGGGTFSTGYLVNPQLLSFDSGTLQLTGGGGFTVGAAGLFGASLSIGASQNLDIISPITVEAGATISLSAGGIISAATVSNSGQIRGNGMLAGPLTNNASGEVQGLAGSYLMLTGSGNTNSGQITLSGGQVHLTQDFTNSPTGLVIGNGTLRADGGMSNNGTMAFSATANIIGDVTNNTMGLISSSGGTSTFFDDVINNGEIRTNANSFTVYFGSYSGSGDTGTGTIIMEGDLKPGSSPGTMAFGGGLSFGPESGLEIEIGGLLAGSEYDQVTAADRVSLGGTLDISLIEGFTPTAGDTFEIINAANVFGTFDTMNLPSLPDKLLWFVNYSPTSIELVSTFSADFDEDGDVDDNDLAAWEGGFGSASAVHKDGDADADTFASGSDFLIWQRQFGKTAVAPASIAATTIPEPSSLLLVVLGLITMSARRKHA